MFQFDYTITDDDYLKFNLNHSLHTKIGKRSVLAMQLCIPCIFILIILLSSVKGAPFSSLMAQIVIYGTISALWIILYKKLIIHNIRKTIRTIKKSGRLPYTENGTLIFDENYICENTALQETKTSYNLVEAIYTTNEALYIYNSAVSAIILPNRFIESQDVFNRLKNFLQEKTRKTIINITK